MHSEPDSPTRNPYQRDRDRIVHSSAFRRLVYKTQVFLNHEGDLFRTRLTHSLEVAQLARTIARDVGLHEDLVEAVALAHDLGHTPFGHAGQHALNGCMLDFGGFEHNLQSLRVVDGLEQRYPDFDGLNLCFETREGILKHCSRARAEALVLEHQQAGLSHSVGARFLTGEQASLEAQLCNLADEIAYNAHDLDDGVRSGLITLQQALEVPIVAHHHQRVLTRHPRLAGRRLLYEVLRQMLSAQVYDVLAATRQALLDAAPASAEAVRRLPKPLIQFSPAMRSASLALKGFLFRSLYRHPQVVHTAAQAQGVVQTLFSWYLAEPAQLPEAHRQAPDRPRAVADYIAGMTDRFAQREFERCAVGGRTV